MLTDADIQSFQSLYQKHFGRVLDKNEAHRMGEDIVRLVRIVYEPSKESYKSPNTKPYEIDRKTL